ncbi:MAG: LCP family protein [Lachnospiraceae bacterium]|nr:LCP family protein [Lachnospiraceae bacterium]
MKKEIIAALIGAAAAILLVLGVAALRGAFHPSGSVSEQNTQSEEPSAEAQDGSQNAESGSAQQDAEPEETSQPAEEQEPEEEPIIASEEDVTNLLLIGQDKREGEERQRSDSMILCSINRKDNTIRLVSFMRDMYVEIPGYKSNKINAAYVFGGMQLLDETLKENFGVRIDGNVEVDFDSFIQAVTEIGPIVIELSAEEAAYLNSIPFAELSEDAKNWELSPGLNQLNAEQALAYSRTRFVGNADFERTDRQRRIMMAAIDNLRGKSVTQIVSLINKLEPYFITDMTNGKLIDLAVSLYGTDMNVKAGYRIPVSGTFTVETIDGQSCLVPDLEENTEWLRKYLYEGAEVPEPTQEAAAVEMDIALSQKGEKLERPSSVALVEFRKALLEDMDEDIFKHVSGYLAAEDNKWTMLFTWPYFIEGIQDPDSVCWDFLTTVGTIEMKGLKKDEVLSFDNLEDAEMFVQGMRDVAAVVPQEAVKNDLLKVAEHMETAAATHDPNQLHMVWEMLSDLDHYVFNYDATDQQQLTRIYNNTLGCLEDL